MKIDITKIIGYVLLTPALVSIILFFKVMLEGWGTFNTLFRTPQHAITLALPIFIGITALVGAYLIKEKK